jgi:hypothetical protein
MPSTVAWLSVTAAAGVRSVIVGCDRVGLCAADATQQHTRTHQAYIVILLGWFCQDPNLTRALPFQ